MPRLPTSVSSTISAQVKRLTKETAELRTELAGLKAGLTSGKGDSGAEKWGEPGQVGPRQWKVEEPGRFWAVWTIFRDFLKRHVFIFYLYSGFGKFARAEGSDCRIALDDRISGKIWSSPYFPVIKAKSAPSYCNELRFLWNSILINFLPFEDNMFVPLFDSKQSIIALLISYFQSIRLKL